MRGTRLISALAIAAAVSASVIPTRGASSPYSGFKVFRIKTHGHAAAIQEKLANITFEQWNHDVKSHMDIVLGPDQLSAFAELGLESDVMHTDLGASIAAESAYSSSLWRRQAGNDSSWFDSYHDYGDHVQYLETLRDLFPDNSEIISSGYSYENRSLHGIHLWGADGPGKPAVLYHGTVHAREWISTAVTEYLTYKLVTGYNAGDKDARAALDKYDFYIIPVVNPDGFVYTQTTDRLWRKNRQPGPAANPSCYGRDINRNWEFAWDADPRGSSTNPCSQTYRGESPSDAPETRGLDGLVRRLRDNGNGGGIKLYIDWHSYGQYILSPFGYKETLYAPELGKWTQAAQLVSDAIRDAGADDAAGAATYTFGPSGATLYPTTGAAPDHVYSIGRAAFSYTIELRDTGRYGFVLPPELIRPVVEEQWAGQKVLWGLLDEEFFGR